MDDDFFKDLVPIKAPLAHKGVNSNTETSSVFSDDAVLSAVPDARPPAESINKDKSDSALLPLSGPMGEPRQRKEMKETEKAMQAMLEATFKRFAGGLQKVLEDVQTRLESVEGHTKQMSDQLQELSEARAVDEGTHAQRFDALFSSLRDIQRGVQVVRDKQELIEAQAELAKLTPVKPRKKSDKASVKTEAAKTAEEPNKASEPAQPPAPALSAPAAPPPAAAVAPTSAPAAPPLPTAPQQQETPFSAQPAQQAQAPPPSLPAYGANAVPPPPAHSAHSAPSVPAFPPGPPPPPPRAPPQYGGQQQQQQHPGELPSMSTYPGGPQPPQQYPQAPPPPPQFPGPPEALQHMQYSQAPPPQPSSQYDGYSQSPRPGMPQGGPHFRPPTPPMGRMDSYGPPPPQPPPPSYGRTSAGYPSFSRPPPDAPPPPGLGSYGGYGGGPPPQQQRPAPPPQQPAGSSAAPTTRSVPLEKVIDDVASMGFSRHEVHGVISDLMDNGQSVDLNIVLDRLMRSRA